MLESLRSSLWALFWSCIMVGLVLYIYALVFVQGMADHIIVKGDDLDSSFKKRALDSFGSLPKAMLTLYMAAAGGVDWSGTYHMVQESGPLYGALFILFTFFFTFALFNILTGIMVE